MTFGKYIFGKFSDVAIGVCGFIGDGFIDFFQQSPAACVLRIPGHAFDDKKTSFEFIAIIVPIIGASRPQHPIVVAKPHIKIKQSFKAFG